MLGDKNKIVRRPMTMLNPNVSIAQRLWDANLLTYLEHLRSLPQSSQTQAKIASIEAYIEEEYLPEAFRG